MANIGTLTTLGKTVEMEQIYFSPVVVLPTNINVPLSSFYSFIGQVLPWPNEAIPPIPDQSVRGLKTVMNNIIAAKKVTPQDISPIINRNNWTANTVYNYYRDDIDLFNTTYTLSNTNIQSGNTYITTSDANTTNLTYNAVIYGNGLQLGSTVQSFNTANGVTTIQLNLPATSSVLENTQFTASTPQTFYIKNRYDQVFKCLWNNNGAPSTIEPSFAPGVFQSNDIFQGSDGYKWYYMYTIDQGSKQKFMDSNWIPVAVGEASPNPLVTTQGSGSLDTINVVNGGSGYDPANSAVYVTITGNGQGAAAHAVANNGVITDIVVDNAGNNYTYATVTISSASGTGAQAVTYPSPIGGHGYDPASELGAKSLMLTATYSQSENGYVPTDISYRQIGFLINSVDLETNPNPANSTIYSCTTNIQVSGGSLNYTPSETVYQGISLASAIFTGTVVDFDSGNNIVRLINTTGTAQQSAPVYGASSGTIRTALNITTPTFVTNSGYVVYVQNRTATQRSSDGTEQFRIVLGF
jgi:hypothetical protein